MKRKTIFIFTIILILCCIAGCAEENKKPGRSEKAIIHDLIYTFDVKQENPDTEKYLAELKDVNPRKAAAWEDICDIWKNAYSENYVNKNILPDGLPGDNSLALVVLGFELNSDGTMQDELISRLRTTYDCAMKYPNAYVLVTGGGTARNNPNVTEADSMAAWLRSQGIDEGRLIVENKSMTTLENASNSFRILDEHYPSVTKLAIITSNYHVPWGVVNFEGVIQYEAYQKNAAAQYEIISNAGCEVTNPAYTVDVISQYQTSQLWRLENN